MRKNSMIIGMALLGALVGAAPCRATELGELKDYKDVWCAREKGTPNVALDEITRIDCVAGERAVVIAFGPKWAEAMGSAITLAARSGKRPGVVLVVNRDDQQYVDLLKGEAEKYQVALWVMQPDDLPRPERKQSGISMLEVYVGLFAGPARFSDATITATVEDCNLLLGCMTTTASKNITYEPDIAAGVRLGLWGVREYENLGLAMEFGNAKAPATNSAFMASYDFFTIMAMARVIFSRSDDLPQGHYNLYAGLGYSRVEGDLTVTMPELPHGAGGPASGNGTTILFGASVRFPQFTFFLEERMTTADLSSEKTLYGVPGVAWGFTTAEVSYTTSQTVFGVSYGF